MISRKLLHDALNQLAAIQGFIELAELEPDETKRNKTLTRSLAQIEGLVKLLKSHEWEKVK
jgi:hypothetical protein